MSRPSSRGTNRFGSISNGARVETSASTVLWAVSPGRISSWTMADLFSEIATTRSATSLIVVRLTAAGLEDVHCADDIHVDRGSRPRDGLGCAEDPGQVQHGIVLGDIALDACGVEHIATDPGVWSGQRAWAGIEGGDEIQLHHSTPLRIR